MEAAIAQFLARFPEQRGDITEAQVSIFHPRDEEAARF